MKLRAPLAAATLLCSGLLAGPAAATVISASDIATGSAGGLTFTASGGSLGLKTVAGVEGVGVSTGAGGNEIDIGQSIGASASSGFTFGGTTLAFLFDGPEYGDYQEVAQITGEFQGGGTSTATITNLFKNENDLILSLMVDGVDKTSTLVLDQSEATGSSAATVNLGALFGDSVLSSITFEALIGECGTGKCNNQSDYSIASLTATAVPEPGTVALLGLGLFGLGAVRRCKA